MDRKTLSIILGVALIASFFLPLTGTASGLDIVKGPGDWKKYLWLIIPICGLFLVLGEMNKNYLVSRSMLTILPLLVIVYFLILGPLIDGQKFDYIFKGLGKGYGTGMWIAIVSSIVLAFYNPRK